MAVQMELSSATANEARQAIITAARDEIQSSGILGLRIAEVAQKAHYAPSAIYRYFGDRNGLLAVVLGDLYEETLSRRRDVILAQIPVEGPVQIGDIVRLAPAPSQLASTEEQRIRLQILAVAATNPALERRIASIAQRQFLATKSLLEALQQRLPDGQGFDVRVFTIMIVNQLLYYNTLLGEHGVSDEDYYAFLEHVATCDQSS